MASERSGDELHHKALQIINRTSCSVLSSAELEAMMQPA